MNEDEDNFMPIHFCTKDPCPLQDKELVDILENGFETFYTNNKTGDNICHKT